MSFEKGEFPSQVYSMDEKLNYSKPQKRSVKSYATRVFQESTIGIVASIASSHSNARRLFKSVVFIMCLMGFSYQCTKFLLHVFEHPTTVDVKIRKSDYLISPGFTFCNNNGIKRSDFCGKFPERCHIPSKKFCSKFQDYCSENGSLPVPKREYYNLEKSLKFEEILQLGVDDKSEFLPKDKNEFWNKTRGPYIRTKHLNQGVMLCYTLRSVIDSPELPQQLIRTGFFSRFQDPSTLTFYVRGDDMFVPAVRPGVLFSIHSPYQAVNPFEKGIFLKPGRDYKIYVTMEVEMLLAGPFKTDCINYEETWKANNRTGPRIQEMCKEKCLLEGYLSCYNCVGPEVLYPSTHRICNLGDYNSSCPERFYKIFADCINSCKDDCELTRYISEVMDRYDVTYGKYDDLEDNDRLITVEIIVEDKEVMIFEHSPKYMTVEVFSSIGGFIGCWLGISLMDIIDVLASGFSVFRYSLRKYRKQ